MAKYDFKKLPPAFKEKWLAALRSGGYNQSTDYLRINDGFCCLGVACDINKKSIWQKDDFRHQNDAVRTRNGSDVMPREGDLPAAVLKILQQETGNDMEPQVMDIIAGMNDKGRSFKQIALWIERHL